MRQYLIVAARPCRCIVAMSGFASVAPARIAVTSPPWATPKVMSPVSEGSDTAPTARLSRECVSVPITGRLCPARTRAPYKANPPEVATACTRMPLGSTWCRPIALRRRCRTRINRTPVRVATATSNESPTGRAAKNTSPRNANLAVTRPLRSNRVIHSEWCPVVIRLMAVCATRMPREPTVAVSAARP